VFAETLYFGTFLFLRLTFSNSFGMLVSFLMQERMTKLEKKTTNRQTQDKVKRKGEERK
jgi:hypothetical protein